MGKIFEMEVLQEGLFSWTAVYMAVTFPAFFMGLNFIFGDCFLNEVFAHNQYAGSGTGKGYHWRLERMLILFVFGLFVWQYYTYMFQARKDYVEFCNPPVYLCHYFVWLVWRKGSFPCGLLGDCSLDDICFLVLWSLHVILYFYSVTSVPQVGKKTSNSSFCRKCRAYVEGMDHHCFIIGNCVGSKNRRLFLCLLAVCALNMFFLLLMRGAWAYAVGGVFILLGLLLVICVTVVSSCLLLFQFCLLRKDKTTLLFFKEERQLHQGFWRTLVDLIR
ncbi:putative zinc-finger multi-pass transmembrane protein [Trypanosoma cruzi]|uniref:Palmitoyltransferase n=2 Tax=Trypanosoma cruzi TaxID=5693 RepID=Q4CZ37_TRYCC|nr:zinc-finger multi-pass transmembrane protein, putative [Trypanosoma cruzi]EAN85540.1 zinc-finger multi-pass transmembrane protein, putative [Trypanosoma cruzi]PWV18932.1 putative zinc-finger multi-pass transmembrane protein [Trypanosoma cruzi]RNC59468.1 zinc-finger multi-pass transmembrane protein [Trypanosoma cruzi]|eukprot:XP_807391.1 zinc-finger multi-pass transmembrane protein [Trypanosoma cruzi strain CL Brener]